MKWQWLSCVLSHHYASGCHESGLTVPLQLPWTYTLIKHDWQGAFLEHDRQRLKTAVPTQRYHTALEDSACLQCVLYCFLSVSAINTCVSWLCGNCTDSIAEIRRLYCKVQTYNPPRNTGHGHRNHCGRFWPERPTGTTWVCREKTRRHSRKIRKCEQFRRFWSMKGVRATMRSSTRLVERDGRWWRDAGVKRTERSGTPMGTKW